MTKKKSVRTESLPISFFDYFSIILIVVSLQGEASRLP